jgi:hypothetical protein
MKSDISISHCDDYETLWMPPASQIGIFAAL